MKLEFYPEEKLKREILNIAGKYLDLNKYRVFFFGSRSKGDNFPRSDIDIGILGPVPVSAIIKMEVEEELEKIPTLYKFDLIDFAVVSKKFKKEALKYVEYIK
jgi:predicted nucleotidyltransferase